MGSSTPSPSTSSGMADNVAAALAYIWIVGLIFLFIEPFNKKRFVRFHAFQSVFYGIAWVVVIIALNILSIVLAMMNSTLGGIFSLVALVANLGLFVLWIFAIIQAYQNKEFQIPIVGALASKQAGS